MAVQKILRRARISDRTRGGGPSTTFPGQKARLQKPQELALNWPEQLIAEARRKCAAQGMPPVEIETYVRGVADGCRAASASEDFETDVDPPGVIRILRRPHVSAMTGLPRSTLYDEIAAGKFPKPIPLGRKSVGWLQSEVVAWQRARITQRDNAPAKFGPE